MASLVSWFIINQLYFVHICNQGFQYIVFHNDIYSKDCRNGKSSFFHEQKNLLSLMIQLFINYILILASKGYFYRNSFSTVCGRSLCEQPSAVKVDQVKTFIQLSIKTLEIPLSFITLQIYFLLVLQKLFHKIFMRKRNPV